MKTAHSISIPSYLARAAYPLDIAGPNIGRPTRLMEFFDSPFLLSAPLRPRPESHSIQD